MTVQVNTTGTWPEQVYAAAASVVFCKTEDRWGGLSNMAAGYALTVCGVQSRSSEHLFQALKFPTAPDVQRRILTVSSPMRAKMEARKVENRASIRADWQDVNLDLMRWCIRVKLAQHPDTFGRLLLESGVRPIVEQSPRSSAKLVFWAALPKDDGTLRGPNVLGRLLMELRDELLKKGFAGFAGIEAPRAGATLLGRPVGLVLGRPSRTKETV